MYYRTSYESPIGSLTLVSDENNLIGLWMENQKYFMNGLKNEIVTNNELDIFTKTKNWLDRYFNNEKPDISELPLKPIGSDFKQDVWKTLCEIPYGEVTTYKDIANKLAVKRNLESMSSQAVGGAVGHNPISIIIPCHRVIGSNKSLTGYAGGIDRKIKLLAHEGIDTNEFTIPSKGTAI